MPGQGELSLARQAERELLGAARDADGGAPSAVWYSFPRWATRCWSLSSERMCASPTCSVALWNGKDKPPRLQRRTARMTSASSSRARGITCFSTTARRVRSRSPMKEAAKCCSTTMASSMKDEKGNSVQDRQQRRLDHDRGRRQAQNQGGDHQHRGDRDARRESERHARAARRACQHQLMEEARMGKPAARLGDPDQPRHAARRRARAARPS